MENNLRKYSGKLDNPTVVGDRLLPPYIPEQSLVEAVNLTIMLQKRPLLLMGEPGCGKTRLAEAVAYDLYGKDYRNHYFEWNVKSTSKAKDGLYIYDSLRRFNDAQINAQVSKNERVDINNLQIDAKGSYIKSGPLAKAIMASEKGKPAILLIDEIDKADFDFPNDLLNELENYEFRIEETGDVIIPETKAKPLIFITSNGEKELPPPFLRRCIFHLIKFPKKAQLEKILQSHFLDAPPDYVKKAVGEFWEIRKQLEKHLAINEKKTSTSELIDWFTVIHDVFRLRNKEEPLDDIEKAFLKKIGEWLKAKPLEKIPFHQLLLKNLEAQIAFKAQIGEIHE